MLTTKKAATDMPPTMKAGKKVPQANQETIPVKNVAAGYKRN